MVNLAPKKSYTASYSDRAGRNGEAPDNEHSHIVELFREGPDFSGRYAWKSWGVTLCGVTAERDRYHNLVAAKSVGTESATCKTCAARFYMITNQAQKQAQKQPDRKSRGNRALEDLLGIAAKKAS